MTDEEGSATFSAKGVVKMYGCRAAKKKKIGEIFQKLNAKYFCQRKLFWDTPIQGGSDKSGIFFFLLSNDTAQLKIIRFV